MQTARYTVFMIRSQTVKTRVVFHVVQCLRNQAQAMRKQIRNHRGQDDRSAPPTGRTSH